MSRIDETRPFIPVRIAVLTVALPQANAREAEAVKQAEAAARIKFEQAYARKTAEAQAWLDDLLARLPTGPELTKARDLRDSLGADATQMRTWLNTAEVRRPLDPLEGIQHAFALRLQRIERSRWIGSSPITLASKDMQDAMATAVSRVVALERTHHD
jgi:hypothetical protein